MVKSRKLLTITEAAEYLNVSKSSLRRWSNDKVLRSFRVGRRGERRFDISDLDAFLVAQGKGLNVPEPKGRVDAPSPRDMLEAYASRGMPRHVSLHFRDEREQWALLAPYLIDHLSEGGAVLYLHDSSHRMEILGRLRGEGVDVDSALEAGRLALCGPQDSFLRDGFFSADRMLEFVRQRAAKLLANPSGRALITAEMTWYLTGAPGVEQMLDYEQQLNRLLRDFPGLTIVSQYHLRRLDAETMFGALLTHPFTHSVEGFRRGLFMDSAAMDAANQPVIDDESLVAG